jgi:hypothetical protein
LRISYVRLGAQIRHAQLTAKDKSSRPLD